MPAALAVLALALLATLAPEVREDDVIYLVKKKKPVKGQVVYEDADALVLRNGSREKRYLLADIAEVDSRLRNLDELLDRLEALGDLHRAPVEQVLELAAFAAAGRLPGEARMLYMAVLDQEPENEVALDALDARKKKGGWSIKLGGDWWATDELDEAPERWKDRYVLNTAHYVIETNQPVPEATLAAFDCERLYRAFYDMFAEELGLREPDEDLQLELHADETSYPETSDKRGSAHNPGELLAHVRTRGSTWRIDMIHALVQQLTFQTTERTPSARGKAPPWLTTGMAIAFSTNMGGAPGRATFDLRSLEGDRFRAHAEARKPMDLDRVLVLAAEDFATTFELDLKFAQCYTLFHFLMFGAEGRHHDGFLDYMKRAWDEGRMSEGDFEDALDVDDKDLQEEWSAYARERAR